MKTTATFRSTNCISVYCNADAYSRPQNSFIFTSVEMNGHMKESKNINAARNLKIFQEVKCNVDTMIYMGTWKFTIFAESVQLFLLAKTSHIDEAKGTVSTRISKTSET